MLLFDQKWCGRYIEDLNRGQRATQRPSRSSRQDYRLTSGQPTETHREYVLPWTTLPDPDLDKPIPPNSTSEVDFPSFRAEGVSYARYLTESLENSQLGGQPAVGTDSTSE